MSRTVAYSSLKLLLTCLLPSCMAQLANTSTCYLQNNSAIAGLPNLQEMPATQKGADFQTCLKQLGTMTEANNVTQIRDIRVGETQQPIADYFDETFSEQVAYHLPENQVTSFCSLVNSQEMRLAMREVGIARSVGARERTVKPLDFVEPFGRDPESGIYLPHDAEYSLTNDPQLPSYSFMMASAAVAYPDPSGESRSDTETTARIAIECQVLATIFFVVDSACEIAGATGEYLGSPTGQGKWLSISKLVCVAAKAALNGGKLACDQITAYVEFIDGLVDAMEIQASYENAKKSLDNELIIWRKIDGDSKKLLKLFEHMYQKLDNAVTVLATQNCETKTRLAEVQREVNYLRYLVTTPEAKRPRFQQTTQGCALSPPQSCEQAVTRRPIQPVVFEPPAECKVSDGTQQIDISKDSKR